MTTDSALFVPAPPGWRLASYQLDNGAGLSALLGWRFSPPGAPEGWPVIPDTWFGTADALNPTRYTHLRAIPAGDEFDLNKWSGEVSAYADNRLARTQPECRDAILAGPTHISDAYDRQVAELLIREGLARWADDDERVAAPTRKASR